MDASAAAGERCNCRGQCGQHELRCTEYFGQAWLFGEPVTRAVKVAAGTDDERYVCRSCAQTFQVANQRRRMKLTEPTDRLNEHGRRMVRDW